MSFLLTMLDDASPDVEFDAASDGADTELANDAIEVQEAVNEAGEVAEGIEDGVEVVEAAESLISYSQMAAAGQPVSKSGQYMAESLYGSLVAKTGKLFTSVTPITNGPDFESTTTSESAIRARAVAYCQEGFVQEATALVKRVAAAIAALFEKVVVAIKRLFMSAAKIKKVLEETKSALGKTEDYQDSASDKEITVSAQWLNDGSKVNPTKAVSDAESKYTSYSSTLKSGLSEIKSIFTSIVKNTGEDASEEERAIQKAEMILSSTMGGRKTIAGRPINMSKGAISIGPAPSISKSSMTAMSRSDLLSFIGEAIKLAEALEKHKDHIKDAEKAKTEEIKAISDVAKELEKASTDEAETAKTALLRRRLTTLTKLSSSKAIGSLNTISGVAFGVLFAATKLAKANAKALAKKKSS